MGAWGTHSFANDGALDWLGDFLDGPSDDALRATFSPAPRVQTPGIIARLFGAQPTSTPVRPYGEHVLAAAEVVAAMRGHPPTETPEGFARLPRRTPPEDVVSAAIRGVDSILDESSELHELWKDTEDDDSEVARNSATSDYQKWLASARDIRERLTRS